MHIGYARIAINTNDPVNGRIIINDQEKRLYRAGAEVVLKEQYVSTAVTYPKLSELLKQLKAGDVLMVTKLAQFAKNAKEARVLVKDLLARGVKVSVLNMGVFESCLSDRFVLDKLNAFVEIERAIFGDIEPEVKEEKPAKKKSARAKEIPLSFKFYQARVIEGLMTVTAACEELGISRSTWYKWVKQTN